jgi:hypothetical protein
MNEAQVTSQLLSFLREKLRGLIIKHSDLSTIGVPDFSVTSGGLTQWVEVKLVKFKRPKLFDLRKIVDFGKPQSRTMGLLDLHGRSYYIIFLTDSEQWWTYVNSGVSVASACRENLLLDLTKHCSNLKDFETLLRVLKLHMKEDRL